MTCPQRLPKIITVMNKELHQTDYLLHDLIVPTVNEHFNEDDHYGVSRPVDDANNEGDNQQMNFWGKW